MEIFIWILTVLDLIGVIVKPTIARLEDDDRAMGYEEHWDDNRN